ncbi:hypothetical protein AAHK20_28685 [Trinickia sp. YCB016]
MSKFTVRESALFGCRSIVTSPCAGFEKRYDALDSVRDSKETAWVLATLETVCGADVLAPGAPNSDSGDCKIRWDEADCVGFDDVLVVKRDERVFVLSVLAGWLVKPASGPPVC